MKRRNFLKNIAAGVALPSFIGGFGVKAYANSPLSSLINTLTTDTDHVLVMIQLTGGNDGLNTVIPIDQYGNLYNGRQNIILPESSILNLSGVDKLGLHPSLAGLRDLYDDGQLKIVQSVGYPEQSYSHFRSTDIWMSGSNADEYFPTGWAGRYLNYEYPNYPTDYPNPDMPHPLAIEIGNSMSFSLMGPQTGMGFVIANPDEYYSLLAGVQDPAPNTPAGEQLAYIRSIAQQSRVYAQTIKDVSATVPVQQTYPDTPLAAKLKIVSRLIAGGLKTRMYLVSIGSFDTHNTQVLDTNHTKGEHADLLKELSDAVKAFTDDMKFLGTSNRVTGMTYSEFGRRIASNASGGTDHGAAAPMFIFGKSVAGGILGNNPVIPHLPTDYDNVPMQFDFRSVYASMLRDWFCVDESEVPAVLMHDWPYLNLFNPDVPCVPTAVHEAHAYAGEWLLKCLPNPFSTTLNITYRSEGGPTSITILDASGRTVATPLSTLSPKGEFDLNWSGADLPPGTYFVRLMSGSRQQTKMVVKVGG